MRDKIYDDQFAISEAQQAAYADFVAVVRQLRRDCPWDREQTHVSVKHLLIEEAYEVLEAIESGEAEALKAELGDVLLHVAFHSTIAEQEGRFTMAEVIETETAKLVRRHPHVFGEAKAESTKDVLSNWEQIKMEEGQKKSALEGVPGQLPALLRAFRLQEKAIGVGFDFPDREATWDKVEEETSELQRKTRSGAPVEEREEELGDLLFALVNYARQSGLNPENALRQTTEKFTRRFQHVEQALASEGKKLSDVQPDEVNELWEEAKE